MFRQTTAAELKESEALLTMPATRLVGVSDSRTPRASSLLTMPAAVTGCRAFGGLAMAAGSAFTFSLANAVIKLLTGMPVRQIGFFQLGLLAVLGYFSHLFASFDNNKNGDYENPFGKKVIKRSGWKLIIRGFAGAIALLLRAAAVQLLPIGDAAAIINTSPVFVTIFAWAYLRERVNLTTLVCILLTITGSVLIAKPTVLFGTTPSCLPSAAWTPLVGAPPGFVPANNDAALRQPILNGKSTNLTLADYNQLKLDASLDRHPMAMATDFERPLNTLFTMFDQQQQVGEDADDDEIIDVRGAIQYRDNSAAMTPRLNDDPLRTIEDIRAAYSVNNTHAEDHDFVEMPQITIRTSRVSVPYYAAKQQNRTMGILAALASSIVAAGVFVCVRSMRNENPNVIVMYSGLSGAVFCLVLSLLSGSSWIAIGGADHLWLSLLSVGGLAFVSQFTMTCALRTDNANVVSLARASEVLWGYIWVSFLFVALNLSLQKLLERDSHNFDSHFSPTQQIFVFHEAPDYTSILGAVMILGSVILLTLDRIEQQFASSRRTAATALGEDSSLLPPYSNSSTETRVKTPAVWQHYPAAPPPYDAVESSYEMAQSRDESQAYRRPAALFVPYQRAVADKNYEPI